MSSSVLDKPSVMFEALGSTPNKSRFERLFSFSLNYLKSGGDVWQVAVLLSEFCRSL